MGYSNIDSFDNLDYNLLAPNSIVSEGDRFRYHYKMNVDEQALLQWLIFHYNKLEFFIAGNLTNTNYQRDGVFENEANAGNSAGLGDKVSFDGYGLKTGLTYKFSGKHIIDFNSAYIQKAPSIRNTYTNSRVNHNIVGSDVNGLINETPITEEKIMSFDANYIFRTPIFNGRITDGFYSEVKDANEISFYYADGLVGFQEDSEFVQEILQGIDKKYFGLEFGVEAQIISSVKWKQRLLLVNIHMITTLIYI